MYTSPVAGRKAEDEQKRAVAQSGSALAWGARGRGFESRLPEKQRRLSRKTGPFLLPSKRGFETTTPQGLWAWKRSALPCPLAAETPLGGHPCAGKGEGGGPNGGIPLARETQKAQSQDWAFSVAEQARIRSHGPVGVVGMEAQCASMPMTGTVFSNQGANSYNLSFGHDGVVSLMTQDTPEPTTATLSLPALMALAARRRRKA